MIGTAPSIKCKSEWQSPEPTIRIKTFSPRGSGTGTSRISNGRLYASSCAARIVFGILIFAVPFRVCLRKRSLTSCTVCSRLLEHLCPCIDHFHRERVLTSWSIQQDGAYARFDAELYVSHSNTSLSEYSLLASYSPVKRGWRFWRKALTPSC